MREIKSACFIGSGYVGALTAIVLASKNPSIQCYVVDKDSRQITAWNSDQIPIFEPSLEAFFFDDGNSVTTELEGQDGIKPVQTQRQRKLHNVVFSTDIHGCIAAADMVFLCVDTPADMSSPDSDEIKGLNLSNLEAAIQTIADVSTGHKIIVQKSTAPCGITQWIWDTLRAASPDASFDVLSNPEFLAQGSAIQNLLHPNRVVLGHIMSNGTESSSEALSALKNLYTPWVPDDHIITTDAWSAELGKIVSNALIAQRISSINSISAICEATNANINDISTIAGSEPRIGSKALRAGFGFGGSCLRKDICCLIYLARELGLWEVVDYWRAVINMNDFQNRRIAQRVIQCLPSHFEERKVAILGFAFKKNIIDTRNSTAIGFVRDFVQRGIKMRIYDPHVPKDHIERALGCLGEPGAEGITLSDSVIAACTGCSAIVLHIDWDELGENEVAWEDIAAQMESPKLLFDPCGSLNPQRMRQYGFDILEVGRRHLAECN